MSVDESVWRKSDHRSAFVATAVGARNAVGFIKLAQGGIAGINAWGA
jgi:hypothetical protein